MLNKSRDTCPHCGNPLDDPLSKNRGEHIDCSQGVEK